MNPTIAPAGDHARGPDRADAEQASQAPAKPERPERPERPEGPAAPEAHPPPDGWLRIGADGPAVSVAPGQTLLEAALAHGLRLRSSCRNGTCRACLVPTRSGQVRYRIEWPGLSADEKAEGWILPCVALAVGEVVIETGVAGSR